MKTVAINNIDCNVRGVELPDPAAAGCHDFYNYDGVIRFEVDDGEYGGLGIDLDEAGVRTFRHAACVARCWFLERAKMFLDSDEHMEDEARAAYEAAEAWGAVQEWNDGDL